jgi:hypothetical protein
MIPYGMKQDDARKLNHATLEAMRKPLAHAMA